MTALDRNQNGSIELAAEWLRTNMMGPRPLNSSLRLLFGLTAPEACEAIAMAARQSEDGRLA